MTIELTSAPPPPLCDWLTVSLRRQNISIEITTTFIFSIQYAKLSRRFNANNVTTVVLLLYYLKHT